MSAVRPTLTTQLLGAHGFRTAGTSARSPFQLRLEGERAVVDVKRGGALSCVKKLAESSCAAAQSNIGTGSAVVPRPRRAARHDRPSGHVSPSRRLSAPGSEGGSPCSSRWWGRLQADAAVVVEQTDAGAEQYRSEVDAYPVDAASTQQFAADARAEQIDVLATGKPDGDLGGLARAADEGTGAASGHVVGSGVRDDDRGVRRPLSGWLAPCQAIGVLSSSSSPPLPSPRSPAPARARPRDGPPASHRRPYRPARRPRSAPTGPVLPHQRHHAAARQPDGATLVSQVRPDPAPCSSSDRYWLRPGNASADGLVGVLFILSMLARYQPAEWSAHINVDRRSQPPRSGA
jgi:hypothetical protein